ncbi:helix-turn-helix domain-containing protein [Paenibacillus sp. HJL G12]|uniref:Helix-turn-helix domain-containing protein n=1 Tax=Paenibacillus dendrobii TaxID=2691084 RepID=A0A7X3LHT7_9BACL|nr:helix-turn-helix domain-containing protein [Paenibacillus dendrobii]MWV43898.1 helix-turn-helix domain-containing protein [Paenibacillus dendrobii]
MKKGRMFYNTFIPILVLGIGLVVSFGIYIYLNTAHSVIDRVANGKQSFISQTKNSLEQKIQTIEYAFNTYSTTSSFESVVKNPITEQDFEAYRNVNTQLNYIATMGLEGTEYSLISLEQNWQISNGKLSYLTENDRTNLYETYINGQDRGLFWMKTDNGIRFVNTLPVFSKKKQAIALSDISLQTLDHTLKTEENTPVFILNKQGELMYETGRDDKRLSEDQLQGILKSIGTERRTGMVTLDNAKSPSVKAIYARSAYNNWVYITLLDQKEISGALNTTKFGLIMMGLVITMFIIIIAYLIAVYFNKPIEQIRRSLPKNPHSSLKNEVEWILHSIDTIVTEKENLESLIEAELPQLETQLILNLFRNRISREELERIMPRFGYEKIKDPRYLTVLVQMDSYGDREASDKDLLLLAINRLVEEIVPKASRLLPIILNDKTQATILIFSGSHEQEIRKQVLDYAKAIMKAVREYLKVSVSFGISQTYEHLWESKEACEMSKQALHHRLNLGKESIIFYEDISMVVSGPVLLHYPAELESQLFDAIRLGDEEQVPRFLYPLLAEMMKKNKNSMNFEVALVRFVNNLIQLEQLLGVEVLMTQDNHALYHRLLDIRNPEEIERILVQEVILPMVKSMKEKTNQQFRSLSEKIAAIVRAEYDQELSLEWIADRLHYNPNYLSSIFKKEYGMTFSEYVMNYRIEMAKKWLVETDMTIKDIAERLQYHNSQNFIRSFRKKEQVTPGSYRKVKQAQ